MKYELKIDRLFWGVLWIVSMMLWLSTFIIEIGYHQNITALIALYSLLRFMIGEKPHIFPNDDADCYTRIHVPINDRAKQKIQKLKTTSKKKISITIDGMIDND